MKTRLTLICITLIIALAGTTTLFAQRIPQGHLPVGSKSSGYMGTMDGFKFSPDGKIFAALVGYRSGFTLYDSQNGNELENFAHPKYVRCFAFSPDSKTIATGSYQSIVRIWDAGDIDNGIGIRDRLGEAGVLSGHKGFINSVAFSPDGKRIVSGSQDKTIRVWDVQSRKPLLTIKGSLGVVYSVMFSPDGSMIASGSWGSANLWDANSGRKVHTFDQRGVIKARTPNVTAVTFSPDGKRLFTGNSIGAIHAWRVDTGKHIKRLITFDQSDQHRSPSVNTLKFTPDGNTLAGINVYGDVYLWDANTLKKRKVLKLRTEGYGLAFSPDGSTIGTVGSYHIQLWDANSGNLIRKYGESPFDHLINKINP